MTVSDVISASADRISSPQPARVNNPRYEHNWSRAQALREVRSQRALFYVRLIDVAYFPAFQWRHVQLRPSIAAVLDILHFRTKWQIALWFTEENDVLDGLRPIDAFDLSPTLVINAATAEVRSGNASH